MEIKVIGPEYSEVDLLNLSKNNGSKAIIDEESIEHQEGIEEFRRWNNDQVGKGNVEEEQESEEELVINATGKDLEM